MNFKYYLGAVLSIPLLPIMYLQGKRIRATVPTLPEAKGIEGIANIEVSNTIKIITIGESTIAGVGVTTHEEGYSGTLANELAKKMNASIQWKVYARSGYTAKKIRERTLSKITETKLDLIIIGLGANDAFTFNNPTKWGKEIQGIINILREKYVATPIVFLNMPPIKQFPAFSRLIKFVVGNLVELHGEEVANIAAKNKGVYYCGDKITFQDWSEKYGLTDDLSNYFSDGVHPSKLTYQIWAKETANYIMELEEIKLVSEL